MKQDENNKAKILVVDDDPNVAELLDSMLSEVGYEITIANSAEEGMRADRRVHPDLILLDVVLPEMSGFEACQRFNENHKERYVPIILVTSMSDVDDKIKGLESGADDYITKPFYTEELLARVRSALRTKRLYDELQATREKLTEAEKLATLGEMAITLHHEINNPLQSIVLSAENMQNDLKKGNVSQDDLDIILTGCKRVNDVLLRITNLKRVRSSKYIGDTDMLDLEESV